MFACADDDASIEPDGGVAGKGGEAGKDGKDAGGDPVEDAAVSGEPTEISEEFLGDSGNGWRTLITGHWTLPPTEESYTCVRFTLPEDVYVGELRPISPLGTHHTVLTVAETPEGPDGTTECSAGTNAARMISGSGVGTNSLKLPDGVAVRLKKGEQLVLNLHLFNSSEEELKGMSGTLIRLVPADEIEHAAEVTLAGPFDLEIPVGGPTVQSGNCTIGNDSSIFAVAPHMHQLGIYMKAVAHSSLDGEVVLIDEPYSFDSQVVNLVPKEVRMKAGDRVQVDCTYMNTTDATVHWGDSSLAEMCFAGLFRYPAVDNAEGFICSR